MGNLLDEFSKELGRNAGKWLSNQIMGDSYSTPVRLSPLVSQEQPRKEQAEAIMFKSEQLKRELDIKERELDLKELIIKENEAAKKKIEELEDETKEAEKQHKLDLIKEVAGQKNYIEVIKSVHKDYSKKMDWKRLLNQPEPQYVPSATDLGVYLKKEIDNQIEKEIKNLNSMAKKKMSFANLVISDFFKTRYEWVFKITGSKYFLLVISSLSLLGVFKTLEFSGVTQYFILAVIIMFFGVGFVFYKGASDQQINFELKNKLSWIEIEREIRYLEAENKQDEAHDIYQNELEDYKGMIKLAKGVLSDNHKSHIEALNLFNPFHDLQTYGSKIEFSFSKGILSSNFLIHSNNIIPKTLKVITNNGNELVEEQMSSATFNNIYQDYVCSSVLRIAKDVFQLLPIANVIVNAKTSVLNTANGHYEEVTIVSVRVERERLEKLNFDLLDPSDSMANFNANINFNQVTGFSPVNKII